MGQKILVVEDNELNLKLFCDLLRAHSYEAEPVRDGREAVERARAFAPDLIVMDIQMPHISGLELIERLKTDPELKAIPIMAVTAYAAKGDEERIRDAGAEGYVSKPISVVRFVEAVRALLAAPRAAPAANAFSADGLERVRAALEARIEAGSTAGIVGLLSHGREVHVEALGARDLASGEPMRPDTIFRIASMTKPVTAAAAMILVEEGVLGLDEPVDRFLPELADRTVLRSPEGAPDDVVPAERAITLRDLLTLRMGFGAVMAPPGTYPIQAAIAELDLAPSPFIFAGEPDDFLQRLGSLPLLHQPGEQWMYHTGLDVAGILVARASGRTLGDFMAERIFAPLGMDDTGFWVPEAKLERLATLYARDEEGALVAWDDRRPGGWTRPPAFEAGGAGLVSTAKDFNAFAAMLLDRGSGCERRILSPESVAEMTRDQISPEQKAVSPFAPGFWDTNGWGLGMSVTIAPEGIGGAGRFGWSGGYGTVFEADPATGIVAILSIQRLMKGPDDLDIAREYFKLGYEAAER